MVALEGLERRHARQRRNTRLGVGALAAAAAAAAVLVFVNVVGDNSSTGEPAAPSPSVVDSPNFAPPNSVQPVPGTPGAGLRIPISVTAIPTGMQVESDGEIVSIWGDELVEGGGAFLVLEPEGYVSVVGGGDQAHFSNTEDYFVWLSAHPLLTVSDQKDVVVDGRAAVRAEVRTTAPTGEAAPSRQFVLPFPYSSGGEDGFYPYRADQRTSVVVIPLYDTIVTVERRDAPEEQFQELLAGLRLP
ncbi:MAG: hypothetical protein ABWZ26_02300 [Candidatus Nanopelagicales bacterium]